MYYKEITLDHLDELAMLYVKTFLYGKDVSTYLPCSEQIPEYCKSKSPQQK